MSTWCPAYEVLQQTVSRWKSDITYPETVKLLELGEPYKCSMRILNEKGHRDVSHLEINCLLLINRCLIADACCAEVSGISAIPGEQIEPASC